MSCLGSETKINKETQRQPLTLYPEKGAFKWINQVKPTLSTTLQSILSALEDKYISLYCPNAFLAGAIEVRMLIERIAFKIASKTDISFAWDMLSPAELCIVNDACSSDIRKEGVKNKL